MNQDMNNFFNQTQAKMSTTLKMKKIEDDMEEKRDQFNESPDMM